MKIEVVIVLLATLFCASCSPQKDNIDFSAIKEDLVWFIQEVKPRSLKKGAHNVYLAKIVRTDKTNYCVSIDFADATFKMNYAPEFSHFTEINGETVLFHFDGEIDETDLKRNQIYPDSNPSKTEGRLLKTFVGGLERLYLCCYTNGTATKTLYDSYEDVPKEQMVFRLPDLDGEVIYLDSAAMTKFLRGESKK